MMVSRSPKKLVENGRLHNLTGKAKSIIAGNESKQNATEYKI